MSCTVIIGGGIIGCATAYYLLLNDEKHTVHLVDPAPVLFVNVASGKAGGFLAKNWFSRNVAQLGLLSFNLHAQLAEENDGRTKWGWSQSMTFSADSLGNEWDWLSNNNFRLDHKAAASETHNASDPSWVNPSVKLQPMSESGTTAQVYAISLLQSPRLNQKK
jgi:glycine/D-amino acid oxidase-like deaminating enzyme